MTDPAPIKKSSTLLGEYIEHQEDRKMIGIIGGVENHGSIVIVWLDLSGATRMPVYMDHRAFGWMVEAEGIETIGELEGRSVLFDGQTIEFVSTLEIA